MSTQILTPADVARQLRVSQRQLARLRQSGELGCIRLNHQTVRYTQAQVDAFIAARIVDAGA